VRFPFCSAAIGIAVSSCLAIPAFAQGTPDQAEKQKANDQEDQRRPAQAGDIIVTGSKRDTTFLESDLSVTVLDRQTLEDARVRDLRQIDKLVPNVKFNSNGQLSDLYISIRGVESNPYLVNRAAVYIDEIPFRELSNAVLNQVESIEVLRGPQGTLYGANSESGLLLVQTRAPTDSLSAELRATGLDFSSGNGGTVDGFVGGPLVSSTLTGSFAFKISRENSYIRNLTPFDGKKAHIDQDYFQGRLRWTPTSSLTVNVMAYLLNTTAPGVFLYEYVPIDLDTYNANYADAFNGGRRIGKFNFAQDAPKHTRKRERVAGLSATQELGYGRIDFAGSFREERTVTRGYDLDMTAGPIVSGAIYDRERVWNAEVRFTSPDNRPLEYLIGASLYDERMRNSLGTIVGPGGLDDYKRAPYQYGNGRDYSVFATASLTPTFLPKLTASVGLRYDNARRESLQTAGVLDLGPSGLIYYPDADLAGTFEAVLPRFALRYSATPNLTIFGSVAKGYIPGGFNLTAVQAGINDDTVLRYQSETMWSEEIGFKWRLPDGRGYLSGAVFNITSNNWQEIQVATDADGRPIASDYIGSGARIRSRGFELEATYRPVRRVSVMGNIGYSDARYRSLIVGDNQQLRGNRVKLTPEYTAYLAVRYEHPSGIYVRGESSFVGRTALDERNRAFQGAVAVLGAQIGYERENYAVRIFGENLTNKRRFNGLALDNLAFGSDGTLYGPLESPRIVGVELSAKF
jgi:iron complex outermembrane receptor protein